MRAIHAEQWFSKWGPQTNNSCGIPWEPVGNAKSQASPHPYLLDQNLQGEAQKSVSKNPSDDSDTRQSLRIR